MKHESAAAGQERISGVHIVKLGAYPYQKRTDKSNQPRKPSNPEKKYYRCGVRFTVGHIKQCKVINAKCFKCKKIDRFAKVCQQREINNIEANVNDTSEEDTDTYQINIWNLITTHNAPKFSATFKNDFMRQVSINNNIFRILIDTGAKGSVCGVKQAKLWGLISVKRTALCSITYKNHTSPIEYFVLPVSCHPYLMVLELPN